MNSYREIAEALGMHGNICAGNDEDGNQVMFQWAKEFGNCVKRTTFQDNGWAVIHYYHEDGTVEEMFERC